MASSTQLRIIAKRCGHFSNYKGDNPREAGDGIAPMNNPEAEPRGIIWNICFPTQRVGELNQNLLVRTLSPKL
jgi:hypothetical protein